MYARSTTVIHLSHRTTVSLPYHVVHVGRPTALGARRVEGDGAAAVVALDARARLQVADVALNFLN